MRQLTVTWLCRSSDGYGCASPRLHATLFNAVISDLSDRLGHIGALSCAHPLPAIPLSSTMTTQAVPGSGRAASV